MADAIAERLEALGKALRSAAEANQLAPPRGGGAPGPAPLIVAEADDRYLNVEAKDLEQRLDSLAQQQGFGQQVLPHITEIARQQTVAAVARNPVAAAASAVAPLAFSIKASEPNIIDGKSRKIAGYLFSIFGLLLAAILVWFLLQEAIDANYDLPDAAVFVPVALMSITLVVMGFFTIMGFRNIEYGGGVTSTDDKK